MGEDRRGRRRRLPGSDGEDRISKLPDELLHDVLVRLGSARAAARTSVLSRRWRHLWAHLPELLFDAYRERRAPPSPPSSLLDSVDAALSAYSAPALQSLSISLYTDECRRYVTPGRVARWLRFVSQHVVGELYLGLDSPVEWAGEEAPELELPACGMVKTITLGFAGPWRLRLPTDNSFPSLTSLSIRGAGACVDGGELTALVCTQCPRLRNLSLFLGELADNLDVSVRSNTLHSLCYYAENTRRLDVVAPRLEKVTLYHGDEARICAPKLQEVAWRADGFDTCRHRFQDVSRCIRLLEIGGVRCALGSLLRRFDQVGKLKLEISIPQGIEGYKSFLNETNHLPKCKELTISVVQDHHGAVTPAMLHVLRSCNDTRKVSIKLFSTSAPFLRHSCQLPSCPCRLEARHRIDNISLDSLEEVEITSYTGPHHVLILVEQLSRCNNTPVLKKIIMDHKTDDSPPPTKEVCEKIRNMCQPNIEVEFYEDSKRVQLENI